MINQPVSCSVRTEQKAAEAGRAMFRHSSHESASEHWAATWPRRGITSRPDTILMVSAIIDIDGKNEGASESWARQPRPRFSIPDKQSSKSMRSLKKPRGQRVYAERPRGESRGHSIFRSSEKYHVDLGIPKYIRVVCNRVLPVMTVEFPLDLDLDLP